MKNILLTISIVLLVFFYWQYETNKSINTYKNCTFVKYKNDPILLGHWSFDDNIAYLDVKVEKSLCCVMHNQIYIYVSIKKMNNNCYNIFYDSIADIGSGGANLDWNNFSKTKSIAQLEIIDSINAYFSWFGFWDSINNIRILKDSDFTDTMVILNRE